MKYIEYKPPVGGSTNIPELTSDPVSPAINDTWVLKSVAGGTPMGFLLAITREIDMYQLSYKTISGQIVRVILS